MVNAANQTHAGILNLIAQAVSPRDVETASDLRAEAVARTLRIISAQISHLEPARREEADEQYCLRLAGDLEAIASSCAGDPFPTTNRNPNK